MKTSCTTKMNIGYLNLFVTDRLSSDREASLKILEKEYRCEVVYVDTLQNKKEIKPQLNQALTSLKAGDFFVVTALCHLASSLNQLVDIAVAIGEKRSFLISIAEGIDTSKDEQPIFQKLALFQLQATQVRTSHGLSAARARGLKGGRPGLSKEKIELLNKLYDSKKNISEICDELGITRSTLYKYVKNKS